VISYATHPARLVRPFSPAGEILKESAAALLWMQMEIPDSVSRDEVELAVSDVIRLVLTNPPIALVEKKIVEIQRCWQPAVPDLQKIRTLAAQLGDTIRRAHATTRLLK
jgi:hypothetical protein